MGKTKLQTQHSPDPSVKIVDNPFGGAGSIGWFDLEAITNLEGSITF